jgi:isochorismate pyruvate lyase
MAIFIKAEDCKSKDDIRQQIDLIDQELVQLFSKRTEYVREIVKYKDKNPDAIISNDRKMQVIKQRAEWAEKFGLDKDVYEQIFRKLVEHNISIEMELMKKFIKKSKENV